MPCFTADKASIKHCWRSSAPDTAIDARVDTGVITAGTLRLQGHLPAGARDAFVTDKWNPTAMLLADFERVKGTAASLPYVSGF